MPSHNPAGSDDPELSSGMRSDRASHRVKAFFESVAKDGDINNLGARDRVLFNAFFAASLKSGNSLVLGPTGSGKTACITQYAEAMGYKLERIVASVTGRETFLGTTVVVKTDDGPVADQVLPGWLTRILEREEEAIARGEAPTPTVLFLDDITAADERTQIAMLSVAKDRHIAGHRLPDSVQIIAVGEDAKELATGFYVFSRFTLPPPTPEEWGS